MTKPPLRLVQPPAMTEPAPPERKRRVALQVVEVGERRDPSGDTGSGGGDGIPGPEPVWLSDDYLAQRLSDEVLRDGWLYVHTWKQWLRWDGKRWQREPTRLVGDLARKICRREAEGATTDKRLARAVDSEPAARRAERFAEAFRRHAAVVEQFDADPWALNTPSGIVDLRSGLLTPHRAARFLTRITAVAPIVHNVDGDIGHVVPTAFGPRDPCPTWLRVLDEATGGDAATVTYLQLLFGYVLCGVVTEHAVGVFHGALGGEGKTLILNTVAGLMGDYAAVAPADMLTKCRARGTRPTSPRSPARGWLLRVKSTRDGFGRKQSSRRYQAATRSLPGLCAAISSLTRRSSHS
jgi:putative DNA primase/helicase